MNWEDLQAKVMFHFQRSSPPDVDAILFLIGLRELGSLSKQYSKEEKQDLMHIATCRVLSTEGYYELVGADNDGWPHWKLAKPLPALTADEQELLLKTQIIRYFEDERIF